MYINRKNLEEKRIHQGDILEDLFYRYPSFVKDEIIVGTINLPYGIVLTQDCDLERDYTCRKENNEDDRVIQSILICPAFLAEIFREGNHLKELGIITEKKNSDSWRYITKNQNKRFHFLSEDSNFGMPNLIIDFKHYYTFSRQDIYDLFPNQYKVSLDILYREELSQRFSYYISRIGLPPFK